MVSAVPGPVALHCRAFPGNDGSGNAVAARPVGAGKTAGGRERHGRARRAGARAARIGDSLNGQRRLFRRQRSCAKRCGVGVFPSSRSSFAVRLAEGAPSSETRILVLRRLARHRQTAVDERLSASAARSDDAAVAERWPTNRRKPISSPSARLTLSISPRRTSTDEDCCPA